MIAPTDQIRTIREARDYVLAEVVEESEAAQHAMLAAGRLKNFAATYGYLEAASDGTATLDRQSATALGVKPGDHFLAMGR